MPITLARRARSPCRGRCDRRGDLHLLGYTLLEARAAPSCVVSTRPHPRPEVYLILHLADLHLTKPH